MSPSPAPRRTCRSCPTARVSPGPYAMPTPRPRRPAHRASPPRRALPRRETPQLASDHTRLESRGWGSARSGASCEASLSLLTSQGSGGRLISRRSGDQGRVRVPLSLAREGGSSENRVACRRTNTPVRCCGARGQGRSPWYQPRTLLRCGVPLVSLVVADSAAPRAALHPSGSAASPDGLRRRRGGGEGQWQPGRLLTPERTGVAIGLGT